jgi:hypothetical protein
MLIAYLFCYSWSFANESRSPLDIHIAILIAEAQHLRANCGDTVWPGWSPEKIPILLVTEDYEYAIDFPKPLKEFTPIGADSVLHVMLQKGRRTHNKDLCAAFDVEGVQSVVVGSPEEAGFDGARWVLRVIHEMFHVFQNVRSVHKGDDTGLGIHSAEGSWMLSYPFPYQDTVVMESMHLRGYLLWRTLQEGETDNSFYALGTAVDALSTFRRLLSSRPEGDSDYRYSKLEE